MNSSSSSRIIFIALITLLTAVGCATGPKGGQAVVTFGDPAKFSDLQLPGLSREQTAPKVLPDLQASIQNSAKNSIPLGYTVNIDVTEIDQAGFIPNPGGAFPIRTISDNTPAVIAFTYSVTNPAGQVVKSGNQRLVRTIAEIQPYLSESSPVPVLGFMMDNWMGSLGWELSHNSK
ncbi:MAG TPA: DUF3016 domain-containing protein [Verrucomicrobiota bacterium]|nr:hypothetical protein [Verrucomicrobiales bacterium]HRI16575.1 DUF3016 domain-containing protein [Verrucomicrobiota bacterium]